jgi:lysophospholipase L1-like esterase
MKKLLIASILLNAVLSILIINHLINRPKPNLSRGYFQNRDKVFTSLPIKSTDIVFIGDSEIAGFDFSEWFSDLNIKNRGIPGDNVSGELLRLRQVTNGHPAKIFIQGGINDLQNKVRPDSIVFVMAKIIDCIQRLSPTTNIYLQSVLPTNIKIQGIDELNHNYTYIAKKYKIAFIDLDSAFKNKAGGLKYDSGDGLHVSGAGYKKWTEILSPYIKKSEPPN